MRVQMCCKGSWATLCRRVWLERICTERANDLGRVKFYRQEGERSVARKKDIRIDLVAMKGILLGTAQEITLAPWRRKLGEECKAGERDAWVRARKT